MTRPGKRSVSYVSLLLVQNQCWLKSKSPVHIVTYFPPDGSFVVVVNSGKLQIYTEKETKIQ